MPKDSVIKSFEPIAGPDCRILILGTMPGNESISSEQYYGHPDNIFWDIIIRTFKDVGCEEDSTKVSYEEKKALLLSNQVGLWDVLQFCNREGNLDSAIRNEIKNDFGDFFADHVNVTTLIFNGQKAEKYFESCFKQLTKAHTLTKLILPSTSSTHKLNPFTKLRLWQQALRM
ncbi:MAG: DNA-deoxyinosine glycosylase [Chitinophagaceae bacterium]